MSSRLGKGLDALFIDNLNFNEAKQNNEEIIDIELKELMANPFQPRKVFNDEKLDELAQSIEKHGVFQPIIVKKNKSGPGYYIVAGERRFRACKKIGLTKIPAIIREIEDQTMAEIALLENLQRENLTIIEEAMAYQMLIEKYNFTQQEVAERVGKSRAHITNALRLLNLPKEVQNLINENKIEFGHAKVLAGLSDNDQIVDLALKISNENLTVRALEQMIKDTQEKEQKQNTKVIKEVKDIYIESLEEQIMTKLGTQVKINVKESNGKIVIDFYNTADLNRILEILNLLEMPLQ
ncbi:MAG: Chromosome plasmid partitioning protein ParB Stage 0 sporulation protein [Haloplasmataceae bacterium]|jgi:ParB family chromosome partitioning protein|nr:Chromosome plasmid partitioning protein ParB Stage 0 sporulation protein [Haloplasmataceae bacterium]